LTVNEVFPLSENTNCMRPVQVATTEMPFCPDCLSPHFDSSYHLKGCASGHSCYQQDTF